MTYCEDYPCCGHTDQDPCPGRSVISEPWYCDECGGYHHSLYCPVQDWDEPECESCGGDYDVEIHGRFLCLECVDALDTDRDGPVEPVVEEWSYDEYDGFPYPPM